MTQIKSPQNVSEKIQHKTYSNHILICLLLSAAQSMNKDLLGF